MTTWRDRRGRPAQSFTPLYYTGETNRCPGCGRAHWYVGRVLAECGFCATAIALAETVPPVATVFRTNTARSA
jgi:hypothetical protein